jgi:chromosome segregation ATPase
MKATPRSRAKVCDDIKALQTKKKQLNEECKKEKADLAKQKKQEIAESTEYHKRLGFIIEELAGEVFAYKDEHGGDQKLKKQKKAALKEQREKVVARYTNSIKEIDDQINGLKGQKLTPKSKKKNTENIKRLQGNKKEMKDKYQKEKAAITQKEKDLNEEYKEHGETLSWLISEKQEEVDDTKKLLRESKEELKAFKVKIAEKQKDLLARCKAKTDEINKKIERLREARKKI